MRSLFPKRGANVHLWQLPYLIVVGIAEGLWAFIRGKSDNTENR